MDQQGLNFLTLTVVDWTDVFTRKQCRDIIIDSLKYCQTHKGLEIFAYVVMSNHIHLVARATKEETTLSDILRDFKKFTSSRIINWIKTSHKESRREWLLHRFSWNAKMNGGKRNYQLWQRSNYPTMLYSANVIWTKIQYIHLNPVRAGWVNQASHYVYSSALNYQGEAGPVPVTVYDGLVYNL